MGAEPFEVSNNSYSGALEAFGVQECSIVGWQSRPRLAELAEWASASSRVARVRGPLDDSCQHGCGVRDCSSVGANGVLCVGDGDDASSANKADSRFDTYDSVSVCWADDAAVSFSADGNCGQVSGSCCPGSRTGAARVAVDCVGVVALAPAAGPAAGGEERAEVGPLAQIGFARIIAPAGRRRAATVESSRGG